MLQQLTIRNYQRHKNLTIHLDPHITTVVGSTDKGKSAVLRSIKWLCLNVPRGKSFIRRDSKGWARVSLTIDDHIVIRTRGKANTYKLDKRRFVAFGNEVPKEVQETLRISPLNFQGQHDSPFWFGESASEVSKQLNAIVDLGLIDTTLSNLASMIRKTRAERDVVEEMKVQAEREHESLSWVGDAEKAYQCILKMETSLNTVHEQRTGLGASLDALRDAQRAVEELEGFSQAGEDLRLLEESADRLKKARDRTRNLQELTEEIEKQQTRVKRIHSEMGKVSKRLGKLMGDTCVLCGATLVQ
jgi:exonuclease SbcC